MATDPRALAKALVRANTQPVPDPGSNGFGAFSPTTGPAGGGSLAQPYGNWSSGRGLARTGLPRDPMVFQAGSFGPLTPMQPMPIDTPDPDTGRTDPRRWQYPVSWNMPHGVPGDEGLKLASFAQLRCIGDTYSVARACIRLRKDELLGLGWDIVPTKAAEKAMRGNLKARKDFDARRAAFMKFWRKPDSDYFAFRDWFSAILDDVLVTDALSIYVWPSKRSTKGVMGSGLGELALIDGATIRPLIDVHGSRPRSPNPGYQQYLFGVPRTDMVAVQGGDDLVQIAGSMYRDYPADQLIYRPYTTRDWTPYGFAPVEQGLVPILSGMQRQQYQLDFFSEGTIPGLFVSPGDSTMTPTQIRELQDALNALAGDPAWKHKIIVLPAGSTTDPQIPVELAGTFDEIIVQQVCMAFGVQPMELGITPKASSSGHSAGAANQMAKQSSDVMERAANKPLLEWFSDIFNHVVQVVCGQEDMMWWWEGLEADEDLETLTGIQINQVTHGLASVDEIRVENGKQPWGLPITSDPVLYTPTGIIPFGSIDPETGLPKGAEPTGILAIPPAGGAPGGGPSGQPAGTPPAKAPAKPTAAKPANGQPAGTPAHAGAAQNTATTQAASTAVAATQKPTPKAPAAKAVNTFAALRELDAARRRLNKGRTLEGWIPEHIPTDLFATIVDTDSLETVRKTVRAAGRRQRRDEACADAEESVRAGLQHLTDSLGNGSVSTAGFVDSAVGVMRDGIRAALGHGANHARDDGIAKALGDRFTGRYGLYAGAVFRGYEQGYGLATVGGSDDPDNIVVTWNARPGACDLCEERDGEEFTVVGLPGFPGEGGFGKRATICRGGPNCRCSLAYHKLPPDAVKPGTPSGTPTPAQQQLQRHLRAASAALNGTDPQVALASVLDDVADTLAEQQRPYLTGFLQDILAARAGMASPDTVTARYTTAPDGGLGWLVPASVISAVLAARIAEQVRSQQQAQPETVAKYADIEKWNPDQPRGPDGKWLPTGHVGTLIHQARDVSERDRSRVNSHLVGFAPRKINGDEGTDYARTHATPLTPDQADAVRRYTGPSGFIDINKSLRAGVQTHQSRLMDSAMKPTEHDLIVHRSVSPGAFTPDDDAFDGVMASLAGKAIHDRAFSSTALTVLPGNAPVTMHIAVPKGTKAVIPGSVSEYDGEGEVILSRNQRFAVSRVERKPDGDYEVWAVAVPKGRKR